MLIIWPVIWLDSSEHKKYITDAISWGSAIFLFELNEICFLIDSGFIFSNIGVFVTPGATALTLIPNAPSSLARIFVAKFSADFDEP